MARFEPGTPFVEAYGLLLATLVLGRNGHPVTAVAVAAAGEGDGTTTTVLNLGMMMARTGRRSLLVDANLRNPQLHRAFDMSQAPGVTEVLSQRHQAADAIRPTTNSCLDVLPAGELSTPAHALLDVQRLSDLMIELRRSYQFILLDTPPILKYPDTLNLAQITDGTILVVPADGSSRRAQQEARRRLGQVNVKILGAVLNRVSPRDVGSLS